MKLNELIPLKSLRISVAKLRHSELFKASARTFTKLFENGLKFTDETQKVGFQLTLLTSSHSEDPLLYSTWLRKLQMAN